MELQWFRCWKMLGELYEPKGLALETACAVLETPHPWAVNMAKGCTNNCAYCYGPMFMHCARKNWVNMTQPKMKPTELVAKQLNKGIKPDGVFLSFLTDPLLSENWTNTEEMIALLRNRGIPVATLSKIGVPSMYPEVRAGMTIVSLDKSFWNEFEPNATESRLRLGMLKQRQYPWVSMEPYPSKVIHKQCFASFIEHFKFARFIVFGKWNYDSRANTDAAKLEYADYVTKLREFCERNGIRCHIKSDTLKFIGEN